MPQISLLENLQTSSRLLAIGLACMVLGACATTQADTATSTATGPAAETGAEKAEEKKDKPKVICRNERDMGSRVGSVRVCREVN